MEKIEETVKSGIGYLSGLLFLGLAYSVLTHPEYIINKVVGVMQPIIMEQMKGVIESQKESLMKQAKDMLPASDSY